MSNVRFDELELMLMAMFEQPTLKDTIHTLSSSSKTMNMKFSWQGDYTIKDICKSNGLLIKQIALTLLSSESNKLSLL